MGRGRRIHTNAVCASENLDAFMELSSLSRWDDKWKSPVLSGLILREHVKQSNFID